MLIAMVFQLMFKLLAVLFASASAFFITSSEKGR